VKSRPIVFDGESVRAILDGRKTQTRRVVKPQPEFIESSGRWRWPLPARARFKGCCTEVVTASREWWEYAPKEAYVYAPGDELWVRETWAVEDASKLNLPEYCGGGNPDWIYYRDPVHIGTGLTWRSPIHMPRWASRITLRVTVTGSYAVGVRMDCHDDGEWIYADDALRILEATEASAHWAPCVQVHITDREW